MTYQTLHSKRAVDGASLQCKQSTTRKSILTIFCTRFSFSSLLSVIHPSLTKPRCYCYTPRAQLLSGLIKRSRQILATVNKSSGLRSLFTSPREFICYALWSSFRSLWKKITEKRNKESIAAEDRAFRGVYQLIFDSPAICWIPLKAPRLPEEAACWSN